MKGYDAVQSLKKILKLGKYWLVCGKVKRVDGLQLSVEQQVVTIEGAYIRVCVHIREVDMSLHHQLVKLKNKACLIVPPVTMIVL